mmetsp:Transcript_16140/g.32705  ORF Transcript_16140/g.32705 Transcript_16140/m.32705 type:complete len:262 (+) Transcript_16140:104-889(+)
MGKRKLHSSDSSGCASVRKRVTRSRRLKDVSEQSAREIPVREDEKSVSLADGCHATSAYINPLAALRNPREAHPVLDLPYFPMTVAKIIVGFVPTTLMKLQFALESGPHHPLVKDHALIPSRVVLPEACLLLFTVKEAQFEFKTKHTRSMRGWGFPTLHGALKGSRAKKVLQSGVRSTLGWGGHLPESFWEELLMKLYYAGFVSRKQSFWAYTLADMGALVIEEIGSVQPVLHFIERDGHRPKASVSSHPNLHKFAEEKDD